MVWPLEPGHPRPVLLLSAAAIKTSILSNCVANPRQEVSLTDAGRELLGELRKAAEEQERRLTDRVDDATRTELHAQLAQLVRLRDLDPEVHREQGALRSTQEAP